MKEHPTMLMKTKDRENRRLEHPTMLMKKSNLFCLSHDVNENKKVEPMESERPASRFEPLNV